jgi:hypothetical protein
MSTRAFRCPVCGGGLFRSVVVPRADGSQYLTCFYECAGCSVMFIDPSAFNANEPGPPSSAGVKLPPASPSMALENYSKAASANQSTDSASAAIGDPSV